MKVLPPVRSGTLRRDDCASQPHSRLRRFLHYHLLRPGKSTRSLKTDINILDVAACVAISMKRRPMHAIERRTDYAQIDHRIGKQRTHARSVLEALG